MGFAGKMSHSFGTNVKEYRVTDPSDNPVNPLPGTLRYGVTQLTGKIWISFSRDMSIKLKKTLVIGNDTTIDARGARVHIAGGPCFLLEKVSNVIIHGIRLHHCRSHGPTKVMGPGSRLINLSATDGDGIKVVASTKVWIDHNTLYRSEDGLIDVTLGSTDITISNNWFRDHDKVMLLGHDDEFKADKNMKVTVVFNHFGPNCNQRMPRVRWGYAHVANNLYEKWELYAIGGSMNPSIKSEANYFVAQKSGNKEITKRMRGNKHVKKPFNFQSVRDYFENGASFNETGQSTLRPNYNEEQAFQVADARMVDSLTWSSGALNCRTGSKC